ncbi:plasmid mobilization protein [Paenibacillus tuaregi]|uniref:plasmid mobilization protein n=1 Tax=Paenibacillus tuaregi TaxID=1816681 RepID=UPI0008381A60|nr:plasmid mobilization relaxosome protein MobC [Paenibacillus tuaregi]
MAKNRYRDKEVKFFCTADELNRIDQKAAIAELDRSKYLRKMALEGYIIKRDFSSVEELVYEINKIGNNINQIARRANEVEYVTKDEIRYLKKQLEGIYSQIEKFYDEG